MIVNKQYQVTIPKALRELSGIEPGTRVEFDVNEAGEVVLVPAMDHPSRQTSTRPSPSTRIRDNNEGS